MTAEKYSLNWHTFSEHLHSMFKDLYQQGEYADVTLVCDDQTQFKAHKIVLSACSPVFKEIIDNNPTQHPKISVNGIQSYEIESILQFMYLGVGQFYHERMDKFIKVAKYLQVKEIRKGMEIPYDMKETADDSETRETNGDDNKLEQAIENKIGEEHPRSQTSNHAHYLKKTDEDDKPKQTPQAKIREKEPQDQISSDSKFAECPECGKEFTKKGSMLIHYRSKHE